MNKFFIILFFIIFAIISYIYMDKSIAVFFEQFSNKIFYTTFRAITKLGQAEIYIIPSILIMIYYKNQNNILKERAKLLFLSVVYSGLIVIVLKFIFARYRPDKFLYENLYGFNWFEYGYIMNSFPSGHSATSMSAFSAFAFFFPKYKYLFLFIGILVTFSRVALYAHFLSDVIVGGLIGYITSYILYSKMMKGHN